MGGQKRRTPNALWPWIWWIGSWTLPESAVLTWSSTPSTVISPKRLTSCPEDLVVMFILKPLELDHLSSGLKNNCCHHTKIEIIIGSFYCQHCHHQVTRVSLRQGLSMLARMGRCV